MRYQTSRLPFGAATLGFSEGVTVGELVKRLVGGEEGEGELVVGK